MTPPRRNSADANSHDVAVGGRQIRRDRWFAGTAMTVGDAALFSELGFLWRIGRAKSESEAMSCSEVVAGMHNNGPQFDSRVMRRGGELLGDGVRE